MPSAIKPAQRLLVAIALLDDWRCAAPGGKDSICRCAVAPSMSSSRVWTWVVRTMRRRSVADEAVRRARGHGREHLIEGAILAVEQQIVLAVEIVIEVGGRQVGGVGNVAHPGVGEAAIAKQPGGGAQNRVARWRSRRRARGVAASLSERLFDFR